MFDRWKPYAFLNPMGVLETLIRLVMNAALLRGVLQSVLRALTGLGISALLGRVVGEVLASTVGLGHTLIMRRDLADINQVMLVMIVIVMIGIAVDKCIFRQFEKWMLK